MTRSGLLLAAVILTVGCRSELDTHYGVRTGVIGGSSVNGTSVLGKMFAQSGHSVSSWSRLSPRLQRANTIVWVPNRFDPPSEETREWLDDWLYEEEGRTLIYVERDFNAEPSYWQKIAPLAPAGQKKEVRSRLSRARIDANSERAAAPKTAECEWYAVDRSAPVRKVTSLEGPWSSGIDVSRAEIVINSQIDPSEYAETLLTSNGDMLVSREYFNGAETSKLIVVANGSFLLNLPLVNHEHRKLAMKLINEVETTGSVVFLESGPDGPPIHDSDPEPEAPTGLELFAKWPLNWVLFQLGLWGLIFACARWPIFGRPKRTKVESLTDFGRHVTALGELFQRSEDRGYAVARVRHYQTAVLGETLPKDDSLSDILPQIEPAEPSAGIDASSPPPTSS